MDNKAVGEAMEAVCASAARLATVVRRATGQHGSSGVNCQVDFLVDSLREQSDACLDGLAQVARAEAELAAVKVHLAAGYAEAAQAMASPGGFQRAEEMAVVAEVACVLTVSERTAGDLLAESAALTTGLPLTLAALTAGSLSWQHARVMVDETTNLDPAGAASLEAHFLDLEALDAARGCPVGELVASRFRYKARTWRERHHQVSIEKRHVRSGGPACGVLSGPGRDGVAVCVSSC